MASQCLSSLAISYRDPPQSVWAKVQHNPYCVIHSLSDERLPVSLRRPSSEQRWKRKSELGQGTCGTVYLEELSFGQANGPKLRAVKTIRKKLMKDRRDLAVLTDFSNRKYVHTRSFVEFFGWFEDATNIYIAMEYFPHGTLSQYIKARIPEDEIRMITGQLLSGLALMHEHDYAHRDLKPDNIFVELRGPQWSVKIGDFGVSKHAKIGMTALRTATGTPIYEAPEIRGDVIQHDEEDSDEYTNAVDMWSLGCVVYQLAAATVPFPQYPRDYKKLCRGRWFPDRPLNLSDMGWELIQKLVVPIPTCRLSAAQALQHEWITSSRPERTIRDKIRQCKRHMTISECINSFKNEYASGKGPEKPLLETNPLRKYPFPGLEPQIQELGIEPSPGKSLGGPLYTSNPLDKFKYPGINPSPERSLGGPPHISSFLDKYKHFQIEPPPEKSLEEPPSKNGPDFTITSTPTTQGRGIRSRSIQQDIKSFEATSLAMTKDFVNDKLGTGAFRPDHSDQNAAADRNIQQILAGISEQAARLIPSPEHS
ncbi:kinase-like domain-containing protein [Aspergillus karnatakaensis]|uniref:serine/threonine-protein kinase n=1 Tax=Aspergillus karnatakaensis TaxID=1810916 RepID=UPI003CCC9137